MFPGLFCILKSAPNTDKESSEPTEQASGYEMHANIARRYCDIESPLSDQALVVPHIEGRCYLPNMLPPLRVRAAVASPRSPFSQALSCSSRQVSFAHIK